MDIDSKINIKVFEGVYEPAEDSYLLIKAMKVKKGDKALDMGCGTGIIAIHLAKAGCDVTAVDINERALENTRENAKINKVKIKIVKSNLFLNVEGKFDVIAFNPPYLPTYNEDIAWDGGREGIETIVSFLEQAENYLKRRGVIYLVMSSLDNVERVLKKFNNRYRFSKVATGNFFFERLFVYKLTTFL